MAASKPGVPSPGPLTNFLLNVRLDTVQRQLLRGEIEELYEHRLATVGPKSAGRWLRREYRRLTLRLLGGGIVRTQHPTAALRPGRSGWSIAQDLRHNLRGLRRTPLFSAAIILIVGLGIGGTTLVYTVVHAVLIAPLPYPGADRIVLLRTVRGAEMWGTSMADLDAIYPAPAAFEGIAGYTYQTSRISLGSGVELLRTKWVTDNYFPLMGIEPKFGRTFLPDEGRSAGESVVMITEAFWDRAFGSDPKAVGSTLTINGEPFAVVGVLPDRLGPVDRNVQIFPALKVETPSRKGPFFFTTIGRIRDGVDPEVARSQLAAVSQRIFPIWQESFTQEDAHLGFVDLKQILVGDVARTLLMVLTAVGLLLLIASANAASLLVARGMTRAREVSIRVALGASRGRIFQLLLGEAALLAGGGAVLGLSITWLGVGLVGRLGMGRLPRVEEIAITPAVLLFFVAVTVGSWAIFGIVAGVSMLRRRGSPLATTAARGIGSRSMRRLRRGLVATQFAVCIPLLICSGLLVSSLNRLQREDFGFDPENLASVLVSLPGETYRDGQAVRDFWENVLPDIVALPDVISAGLANARPPVEYPEENNFELEDRPSGPGIPVVMSPWVTADRGFFETLGVRLVEGRVFNDPLADTMRTVVVDQTWVDRFYPGESPLGRRLQSGGCTIEGCPWIEVVGVVGNLKTTGLADTRRRGTVYYDFGRASYSSINLHLRTRRAPLDVIPAVRQVIASRDPTVPIAGISTADDLAAESLTGRRYTSMLVAILAGVALLLSIVGIYGAMSYFVREHSRDIGIRIALGGGPEAALRLVVLQGMRVALAGTLVGAAAALLLTRYMSALLYDVSATDPTVFLSVLAATLLVAFGASVIPGRSAAATDPAITLREE